MLRRSTLDAQLLGSARSNPRAFAVFYERYEPALLGYFPRRTRDAELSADLTAEVFAAVLVGASRYRAEQETAAAGSSRSPPTRRG